MAADYWSVLIVLLVSSLHSTNAVTQISKIWAIEGTNVTFPWTTNVSVKNIEWFFPKIGETTLMYYDASVDHLDRNPIYDVIYKPSSGVAAMALLHVTTDNSSTYAVRVTTQSDNSEEATTTLEVKTQSDILTDILPTINGEDIAFGINYVNEGNLVIRLKQLSCYGEANVTMTHVSNTRKELQNCTMVNCEFNVDGALPDDQIKVTLSCSTMEGLPGFEIHVNAKTTTSAASETAAPPSTSDLLTYVRTSGSPADGRESSIHDMLNSLEHKLSTESVTTNDNKIKLYDAEKKLVTWQILLITVVCVLFVVFLVVVVIIIYLRKADKKDSSRLHSHRLPSSHANNNHLSDRQIRSYLKHDSSAHLTRSLQQSTPQQISQSPSYEPYRLGDYGLLVAQGPRSFVNIRSRQNEDKTRIPFSNNTSKFTGNYVKQTYNHFYEPKPDYNF